MMVPRRLHPTMARIKAELQKGAPLTCQELEAKVHLVRNNVRQYLKILHLDYEIHIVDWIRHHPQGPPLPVYAWGKGRDKERPPCQLAKDTQRKYRSCPEYRLKESERRKSERRMKRIKKSGSMVSLMLGIKC